MENILEVKDLVVHYHTDDGIVEAINLLNLTLEKGQTLGLVGETGAGKTTLAKSIMGLIPNPPGKVMNGSIKFNSQELLTHTEQEMRHVRGKKISMIFQDPMTSLNPVMPVGEQISEVIQNHENLSKSKALEKASEMLELVGIPAERINEYPHQFSGGMKQRVIIAIALSCNPELLIADEPTTALDVTIQAQVLNMMKKLKRQFNMSMLLITHDLGVVAQTCDHVAIMYAGEIIEYGSLREIFKSPKHPYTIGLFGSIPSLVETVERLSPVKGEIPDPTDLPLGCNFCTRCNYVTDQCREKNPQMIEMNENHQVRCFMIENQLRKEGAYDINRTT